MKPIRPERISDVAQLPRRSDWSEVRHSLGDLVPGEGIVVRCPYDMDINRLRSTILTAARRIEFETGWRLRTKTVSRRREIHCFLAPIE